MPAPLLLVDDDLATIAQVKRLLGREGYEVVLATNAADAIIAWNHHLPKLVIISPHVESDRGRVVLEELRQHPEAQLLHVLLLGETIPGFGYPVAALPLDPETFGATVNELVTGTTAGEGWQVHVAPSSRTDEFPAVQPPPETDQPGDATEPDAWRSPRQGVTGAKTALFSVPDTTAIIDTHADQTVVKTTDVYGAVESPPEPAPEPTPPAEPEAPAEEPPAPKLSPPSAELESSLFGDLEAQVANEVEAEAMASVDAKVAAMPVDRELQDLEDDVRAEAARRREKRLTGAMPTVGLPTPDRAPPPSEVDGFESFDDPTTAPSVPAAAAAPAPPPSHPSRASKSPPCGRRSNGSAPSSALRRPPWPRRTRRSPRRTARSRNATSRSRRRTRRWPRRTARSRRRTPRSPRRTRRWPRRTPRWPRRTKSSPPKRPTSRRATPTLRRRGPRTARRSRRRAPSSRSRKAS